MVSGGPEAWNGIESVGGSAGTGDWACVTPLFLSVGIASSILRIASHGNRPGPHAENDRRCIKENT